MVNLAEIEDEATCEDRRDAEECVVCVSNNELGWAGPMAHGSRNIVI